VIRILFVIPTLDRSGAEKQLTLLASRLPRHEFAVEVVALTRGGPYADELAQHGVPVTVIGKQWKFDPFAYQRLKRLIAERAPDVVHTWLFAANAYGRMAVGGTAKPLVIVSERCVDSWKRSWQLWLDRKLIPVTQKMIGNSQAVTDFYADLGVPRERLIVIPNGIELPPKPTRSRESMLAEFQIPLDAQVVTYIGRLAPQKRVDDLLWAFALLRNINERNVHFIIAGDGPSRAMLERFSQKIGYHHWVRFVGHRPDTRDILGASDAFWLGSSFEGQSNSLMEAMSAGVPVVVSDIAPNCELVEHLQTGMVVTLGDRPGFTHAIQRLLNEPDLAGQLAAHARSRMATDFSVERMVAEHARVYREAIAACG